MTPETITPDYGTIRTSVLGLIRAHLANHEDLSDLPDIDQLFSDIPELSADQKAVGSGPVNGALG